MKMTPEEFIDALRNGEREKTDKLTPKEFACLLGCAFGILNDYVDIIADFIVDRGLTQELEEWLKEKRGGYNPLNVNRRA